jgi:ribosome-binding factor A
MSIRTERVARMIQKEVAQLLQSEFFETSQAIVTVTAARVTADLSIAYVYLSILGTEVERKVAFKRLEDQTVELRRQLAAVIRHQVRAIPELRLRLDESHELSQKIEDLIGGIREERTSRGALDETPVDESLYMRNKKEGDTL